MKTVALTVVLVVVLGGQRFMLAQDEISSKKIEPQTITLEQLRNRLGGLEAGKAQAIANLQAQEGAIEECKYWIGVLERAEKSKTEKEKDNESGKSGVSGSNAGNGKAGGGASKSSQVPIEAGSSPAHGPQ